MDLEQCDDGNTVSGDGCSASCALEAQYFCSGGTMMSADTCERKHSSCCHNSYENSALLIDWIVCSSTVIVCGDNKTFTEEGCDDGNTVSGDGCSASCTVETGFACVNGSPTTGDTCSGVYAGLVCRDVSDALMQLCTCSVLW